MYINTEKGDEENQLVTKCMKIFVDPLRLPCFGQFSILLYVQFEQYQTVDNYTSMILWRNVHK